MSGKTYHIIYTLLWLTFIGFLCYIFQSAHPLWLLIVYLIGADW